MTLSTKHKQTCLALLEVVVLSLFLTGWLVDLSFLGLWEDWLAMMFFWLMVLLFVACLKMFSSHRRLALAGLGLIAVILLAVVLSVLPPGRH